MRNILKITIPKRPQTRPRRIQVDNGSVRQ